MGYAEICVTLNSGKGAVGVENPPGKTGEHYAGTGQGQPMAERKVRKPFWG